MEGNAAIAGIVFAAMAFVAGLIVGRTVEADRWRHAARSTPTGGSLHYGGRRYHVEEHNSQPD